MRARGPLRASAVPPPMGSLRTSAIFIHLPFSFICVIRSPSRISHPSTLPLHGEPVVRHEGPKRVVEADMSARIGGCPSGWRQPEESVSALHYECAVLVEVAVQERTASVREHECEHRQGADVGRDPAFVADFRANRGPARGISAASRGGGGSAATVQLALPAFPLEELGIAGQPADQMLPPFEPGVGERSIFPFPREREQLSPSSTFVLRTKFQTRDFGRRVVAHQLDRLARRTRPSSLVFHLTQLAALRPAVDCEPRQFRTGPRLRPTKGARRWP